MDATDKRILKRLQENARVTVSVLSQEISLSMPAISERLKKLENTGVVQQYTAILDPTLVDKHLMSFFYVSFDAPSNGDKFAEFVCTEPDVKECFYITGDYDYVLKIITKNTKSLEKLLTRIKNQEGIVKTETIVTLSTITDRPTIELE
ncbi:MAG: Lrp/AsnC family transcriptional regulator [Anaerovibrio sp.]|nr:Lrp/AsnC family transcriptional regulator [Anaerovibrio sp.]